MRRRKLLVFFATVLAFSAIIFPAQATSPNDVDPHKVYVCHATSSAANPFVLIHIDVAAWEAGHHSVDSHPDDYEASGPDDSCEDIGIG